MNGNRYEHICLLNYRPVFLTLLYFAMFHAWSTVLKEQVGGLRGGLLYSASGVEGEEIARGEGNTSLAYQSSAFSSASNEDGDKSGRSPEQDTEV